MKKVFSAFPILLLGLASALFSCSNENKNDKSLTDLKEKSLTFNAFFDNVAKRNLTLEKDNVLEITYQWNSNDKTLKVLSSKETEMNWGIAFATAYEEAKNKNTDSYSIICINPNTPEETFSCSKNSNCNQKITDFLKASGCNTTCTGTIFFHKGTNSFYLENKLK